MLKNDLHVHSIGSGHSYSSISEIFRFASNNKMDLIAIADHGPNMEGAAHLGYFENMLRLPKTINGVTFLKSCEANILNENGDIDIPLDLQNKLDFVMAGLHSRTNYVVGDAEKNTQAIINAVKKNKIKIITHAHRPEFPIDITKVVEACVENNVAIELNIESLKANKDNGEFISDIKLLLNEVTKFDGSLVISSDAHYELEIGDESIIKELNIEIPRGILLNSNEQIMEFLGVRIDKSNSSGM